MSSFFRSSNKSSSSAKDKDLLLSASKECTGLANVRKSNFNSGVEEAKDLLMKQTSMISPTLKAIANDLHYRELLKKLEINFSTLSKSYDLLISDKYSIPPTLIDALSDVLHCGHLINRSLFIHDAITMLKNKLTSSQLSLCDKTSEILEKCTKETLKDYYTIITLIQNYITQPIQNQEALCILADYQNQTRMNDPGMMSSAVSMNPSMISTMPPPMNDTFMTCVSSASTMNQINPDPSMAPMNQPMASMNQPMASMNQPMASMNQPASVPFAPSQPAPFKVQNDSTSSTNPFSQFIPSVQPQPYASIRQTNTNQSMPVPTPNTMPVPQGHNIPPPIMVPMNNVVPSVNTPLPEPYLNQPFNKPSLTIDTTPLPFNVSGIKGDMNSTSFHNTTNPIPPSPFNDPTNPIPPSPFGPTNGDKSPFGPTNPIPPSPFGPTNGDKSPFHTPTNPIPPSPFGPTNGDKSPFHTPTNPIPPSPFGPTNGDKSPFHTPTNPIPPSPFENKNSPLPPTMNIQLSSTTINSEKQPYSSFPPPPQPSVFSGCADNKPAETSLNDNYSSFPPPPQPSVFPGCADNKPAETSLNGNYSFFTPPPPPIKSTVGEESTNVSSTIFTNDQQFILPPPPSTYAMNENQNVPNTDPFSLPPPPPLPPFNGNPFNRYN